MRQHWTICHLFAAALCLVTFAASAHAQARCPEGRTASGKCVDPGLAQLGSQNVTVMSQPRLSYTAPPYLPIQDRNSRVPAQTHEVYNLFNYPPVTQPVTTAIIPRTLTPFQLFRP